MTRNAWEAVQCAASQAFYFLTEITHTNQQADRDAGYEWLAIHDEDRRRALDVQRALRRGGQIRAVAFPDLLIAAVAERERLTVLHYDGDYDLIAQITSQPVQWVVPRGTVL